MNFATKAVHVGQDPDPITGATIPPIHITSTYTQEAPGKHKGYEYSRSGNPTRDALQQCLAAIESGQRAVSFGSGLSATSTLYAAALKPGESVVAYSDMYGGTYRLLEQVFRPWGLDARYTDDTDPAAIAALVDDTTRIVWLETPTNPMLRLIDIAGLAQALKSRATKHGHRIWLAVDNTFATPALQRPLELGADIVVHSATKYLGGHSDVIGGALIANDAELIEKVLFTQNAVGAVPGPFDCYLTHRGIKTLNVRMRAHCENAMRIASWCAEQPGFEQVIYPGLPDHPHHELACRQMAGFGGIVTLVLKGGFDAAARFMSTTKLFACAESLGGVESLVNHPAIMTHASMPRDLRERIGVVDGLVRLSVGVEDCDDLIADLAGALAAASSAPRPAVA
jgi:cystathionine beta-lyase/cystathionine gamma-synthase